MKIRAKDLMEGDTFQWYNTIYIVGPMTDTHMHIKCVTSGSSGWPQGDKAMTIGRKRREYVELIDRKPLKDSPPPEGL